MKKAAVISTGSELILGKVIDSNTVYISSRLSSIGISVEEQVTVPDDEEKIRNSIKRLSETVEFLFITGGLGPTRDDLTVKVIADLFKRKVSSDPVSLARLEDYFRKTGRDVTESDLRLAEIPENTRILPNPLGLAPGFILDDEGITIIAMPGVPEEMQTIMSESVVPLLENLVSLGGSSKIFHFFGLKESAVDDFLQELQSDIKFPWGITTDMGTLSVDIRGISQEKIDKIEAALKKKFDIYMLLEENRSPVEELVYLLKKTGLTCSTAESCTGGLIGKLITDIPGASSVFKGSIIAYDNKVKIDVLKVPEKILQENGAVSEEVALSMARNCAEIVSSDISVSTSGIAGPEGGTKEKPVGTVCMGVEFRGNSSSFTFNFPGNRQHIRNRSALKAIDLLRRFLREI